MSRFYGNVFLSPTNHYEPALGLGREPNSIRDQIRWWNRVLPERLSPVCLLENSDETGTVSNIVSVNILYYHHKGEKFKMLCDIVNTVGDRTNVYISLKIEDYLDEFGLCVRPNYRGLGIASELLKARTTLGKAVGLKTTLTVLSSIASQKAADKAGFTNLLEIRYLDLSKQLGIALDVKNIPSLRYMYNKM